MRRSRPRWLALFAVVASVGTTCAGMVEAQVASNDLFVNARSVEQLPFGDSVSTMLATTEPGEPSPCGEIGSMLGATVWYRFTPSTDIVLVARTFDSDYDTVVAVYEGTRMTALSMLACNDDARGTWQSEVAIRAVAGATYHFQLGGYGDDRGNLFFHVEAAAPVANDRFQHGHLIESLPFTGGLATLGATDAAGDPQECSVRASAWYRYTPTKDTILIADTYGSDYDTVIAVHTGTSEDDRVLAHCSDPTWDTPRSRVVMSASAGVTYHFQVGGVLGDRGNLRFELRTSGPPPNDDFAHARVVTSLPFSDRVDTFFASEEAGEPRPCNRSGSAVWYRLTFATDALLVADALGSDYGGVLALYTGTSFDDLVLVACDQGDVVGSPQSRLVVAASAGVSYYLQAGKVFPEGGTLRIELFVPPPLHVEPGNAVRASVTGDGTDGDGQSSAPAVSADGRYVAFESEAANLVDGDANVASDVFVRDRHAGTTTRVSVAGAGGEGNGPSSGAAISADGRHVAFMSEASNLVFGDTNATADVFVHDRDADGDEVFDEPGSVSTVRVSVSAAGLQGNRGSFSPAISADGRHVAFASTASNLVLGDTNGTIDVFVHDRDVDGNGVFDEPAGVLTARVSVASDRAQARYPSFDPVISADGRHVAFASEADNLVRGDDNGWLSSLFGTDVFVHDRDTDGDGVFDVGVVSTTRVSVSSFGRESFGASRKPAISADGRYVAFESIAALVTDDTNWAWDVFVRDRDADGDGTFDEPGAMSSTRVSVTSDGAEAGDSSFGPAISADGRHVSFASSAPNLVAGDLDEFSDVFVHDRATRTTTIMSFDGAGFSADDQSSAPALDAQARVVAFESFASNLVPGDTNGLGDVFVRIRGNASP